MKDKNVLKKLILLGIAAAIMLLAGLIGKATDAIPEFSAVFENTHFNGKTLVQIILMIAFLTAFSAILQIIFYYMNRSVSRIKTLSTVLSSLTRYVMVLVGICWGLSILGLDISTIFAGVGIIALIVGFGAESLIADIVTGAFILFENQYNVGDIVELDGFRGTVDSIGIRTTGIRDGGGNLKIVNNSDIKNIVNRSEFSSASISTVGISYELNLEDVEAKIPGILNNIKAKHSEVFTGEIEYLGVEELADSCVILKFKADVKEVDVFSGRRILNRELKVSFDKAGITIAYPQMDVHMK